MGKVWQLFPPSKAIKETDKADAETAPLAEAAPQELVPVPEAEAVATNEDGGHCVVCLDASSTWIFVGCGHLCLCKGCSPKYNCQEAQTGGRRGKRASRTCRLCRQESRLAHVQNFWGGADDIFDV